MPADDQQPLESLDLRLFQLYVLFGNPSERWDLEDPAVQETLGAHVAWLRGLESSGTMFMGGPFRAPDYEWNGSGMLMVRAESLAAANAIADQDPFVAGGYRTYDVRGWQLNEGQLVLTLNLDSNRIDVA